MRFLSAVGAALFLTGCMATHVADAPNRSVRGSYRPADPSTADFADMVAAAATGHVQDAGAIFSALERRWRSYTPIQQEFLAGVAAVELGRFAEATQHLSGIRGRYPLLEDALLFYLGEAALGAGDGAAAAEAFEALIRQYPQSRWRHTARERLAFAAMAREQWDAAATILETLRNAKEVPHQRIDRALAELAVRRGDAAGAEALYWKLYEQAASPSDLTALRNGLALFRERWHRDPLAGLSADRRIALARNFLNRNLPSEAIVQLENVTGRPHNAEFDEMLGQAYFKARQYPKAMKQLCALADRDGGFMMNRAALLRMCATAAARAQATDEALKRNRQIVTEFPLTAASATALYKTAFLLMESGRYADAADAYRAWLAAKPRAGGDVDNALWNIAWCHYRLGRWNDAQRALDELEGVVGRQRDWSARIAYWRARIAEGEGKRAEARAALQQVAVTYGDHYYGTLAARRGTADHRLWTMDYGPQSNAQLPPMINPRARELAHLGLWQLALEEEAGADPNGALFRTGVEHLGRRWGLDPAFVYAVIHQESRFQSNAVSRAGAIGLMQLMPPTAARLAAELHLRDFEDGALMQPVTNVRLGMWYLRTLFNRFHGSMPMVLAGYNAGEEAVDRWIDGYWKRRGKRVDIGSAPFPAMDEFIEEIPYDETLHYVKRILRNYWGS